MSEPLKNLDDVLNEAVDLTENRVVYVNNVRVNAGENEVVIDLYTVLPNALTSSDEVQAQHVYRYTMPTLVARDFSDRLADVVLPLDKNDALWDEVESLFGAWADIDMSDDWLDELRGQWNDRFADLWS